MRLGHFYDGDRSNFRVYAPLKKKIGIYLIEGKKSIKLEKDELGYWNGGCERLEEGTLYLIEVNSKRYPDPASKYQPQGVHGPSMIIEPKKAQKPSDWKGIEMKDAIIYEMHLGVFTERGTLISAIERLQHLADLGINVIELLPLNACPGKRNWGYDGVYHYALQENYGTYDDLKLFIEEANKLGMAVINDVVYNHFGPEGNYSGTMAPYLKDAPTPWGAAINYDFSWNHGIRDFFTENLRYWAEDIGFDGFRMDAVSLIFDNMPKHIMRSFTDQIRASEKKEKRTIISIAEHLRNDNRVTDKTKHGFAYDSQWNDDLAHVIFANLTGEKGGHYQNFGSFEDIEKAIKEGFVMDGTRFDKLSKYFVGTSGMDTKAVEHVVYIQDHDQVGNRFKGDRMIATYGREKALLGFATIIASPYVPMLFMGEEYGEDAPFYFFADHSDPSVINGVREGRKREYSFFGEPKDALEESTFLECKLRWNKLKEKNGSEILDFYKKLIKLKKEGRLGPIDRSKVEIRSEGNILFIETKDTLTLLNYNDKEVKRPRLTGELVISSITNIEVETISPFGVEVYSK